MFYYTGLLHYYCNCNTVGLLRLLCRWRSPQTTEMSEQWSVREMIQMIICLLFYYTGLLHYYCNCIILLPVYNPASYQCIPMSIATLCLTRLTTYYVCNTISYVVTIMSYVCNPISYVCNPMLYACNTKAYSVEA